MKNRYIGLLLLVLILGMIGVASADWYGTVTSSSDDITFYQGTWINATEAYTIPSVVIPTIPGARPMWPTRFALDDTRDVVVLAKRNFWIPAGSSVSAEITISADNYYVAYLLNSNYPSGIEIGRDTGIEGDDINGDRFVDPEDPLHRFAVAETYDIGNLLVPGWNQIYVENKSVSSYLIPKWGGGYNVVSAPNDPLVNVAWWMYRADILVVGARQIEGSMMFMPQGVNGGSQGKLVRIQFDVPDGGIPDLDELIASGRLGIEGVGWTIPTVSATVNGPRVHAWFDRQLFQGMMAGLPLGQDFRVQFTGVSGNIGFYLQTWGHWDPKKVK